MAATAICLMSAILAAGDLSAAQISKIKEQYQALGSEAIESKPAQPIPADAKVERVDASERIRSASFGHKTTLVVELPAARRYWVEYGKSTNHPAALYGPFEVK